MTVRVLGVDLGSKRVGIAVGDTETAIATPLTVLPRTRDLAADRRAVGALLREWEAECVVVGWPRSLDGSDGPAAVAARAEAAALAAALGVPVVLHDERLTTVTAHHALAEAGLSSRERRSLVDASAAAVLLQDWLDRRTAQNERRSDEDLHE